MQASLKDTMAPSSSRVSHRDCTAVHADHLLAPQINECVRGLLQVESSWHPCCCHGALVLQAMAWHGSTEHAVSWTYQDLISMGKDTHVGPTFSPNVLLNATFTPLSLAVQAPLLLPRSTPPAYERCWGGRDASGYLHPTLAATSQGCCCFVFSPVCTSRRIGPTSVL